MAFVAIGLPTFSGRDDEDLFTFIDLYRGYLNSVGINPADVAGNPTGESRAISILRSCIQESASEWFDRNITGKNWKLNNINAIVANGLNNPFRRLAFNAPVVGNTFRVGSEVQLYATANPAHIVGTTVFPDRDLVGVDTA